MVVEYHHFRKHPYQNIRFLLNPKIWRRSTWLLCGEALRPVLEAARRCSLLTGTPALAKAVSDIGGKGWVAVVVVVVVVAVVVVVVVVVVVIVVVVVAP